MEEEKEREKREKSKQRAEKSRNKKKEENESLFQRNVSLEKENQSLKTQLHSLSQENTLLKEDLKVKEEILNQFVLKDRKEKEEKLNEKDRQLQQLLHQKAAFLHMASDLERELTERERIIEQLKKEGEEARRARESRLSCPGITELHLLCHAYLVFGEAVVSKDQCLGFFDQNEVLRSVGCTKKNPGEKRCEGCKKLAAFVNSSLQNDPDQTKMAPLTSRQNETFKELKEEIKQLKKTQIPVSFLFPLLLSFFSFLSQTQHFFFFEKGH